MLCIHSRLIKTAPHVFTYREGVVSSDMDPAQWLVLKKEDSAYTCVIGDDLHVLRAALDSQPCSYQAIARSSDNTVDVGSSVEEAQKIRVSGKVNARIFWTRPGDVHLIVESGAVVHFHVQRSDVRLLPVVRDLARLVVVGRLACVMPTIDATSHMDTSRLHCTTAMRLGFRGKVVAPPAVETSRQRFVRTEISFPHSKSDCRPVDDDTPADQQCKTCYKRVTNAVFSPCGHVYMCLVCAERHRSVAETNFCCPLCRTPISSVSKDYL